MKKENDTLLALDAQRKRRLMVMAGCVALLCAAGTASATGGSDIFGDIKSMIETYMKGTLGVIISLLVFLVGAVQAIRTSQVYFVIIGIGLAIILYNAPAVIDALMDATVPAATVEGVDMGAFGGNGLVR